MKKVFRPDVYVKVFKITNSYGNFTQNDFNLFKEVFEKKQGLYFNDTLNDFCFDSFRTVTKEIKRVAHNANLKSELLKIDYKSFNDCIHVTGTNVKDINLIISLVKVYNSETDQTNFIITKIEGHSIFNLDNSPYREIKIDEDMKNCSDTTYVYKQYKTKPEFIYKGENNGQSNTSNEYIHRCVDNNNSL